MSFIDKLTISIELDKEKMKADVKKHCTEYFNKIFSLDTEQIKAITQEEINQELNKISERLTKQYINPIYKDGDEKINE